VSIYEKEYPRVTFVIINLGAYETYSQTSAKGSFAEWPVPSLARIKGTWVGVSDLGRFLPALTLIDKNCNVHTDFSKEFQQPVENMVDAVLYLGRSELELKEQIPADVAVDLEYRKELQRRQALPGIPSASPQTIEQENAEIMKEDSDPMFLSSLPKPPDPNHPDPALQRALQECRDALRQQGQDAAK
jgi:hypothetical protein